MKLSKLFTTSLIALCLSIPMAACDGGDDGDTTDTNATNAEDDTTEDGATEEETGPSGDTTCSVYCVAYIQFCAEPGLSTEFASDAECNAACEMWDQAGKDCRYQQIIDGACDQAGNMGSAC
ncbi:hypothetical protein [Enhygromyxa salina]|uniref:Kazal-like domain-containing protein n=1 Tax=Enhygromyxa salina TaxID=215803 RepID=A0A2S9YMA4_9BACT|nr:hypothetical protein [Enhygromyxa salina]PRQ06218.1 hypothetical protein ENSA7_40660 [Enhygromyxa salina]